MKHLLFALSVMALSSAPAFAQPRGSSAGDSWPILLGLGLLFCIATLAAALQRSFRTFFPTLGGLLIMGLLSVGGAAPAESAGIVSDKAVHWVALALFVALLVGPALIGLCLQWRRSGA